MGDSEIRKGMSDAERYIVLKDKVITIPLLDDDKLARINTDDYNALERTGKSGAFKLLRKIGEDFGVFRDGYNIYDVDVEYSYSKRNLQESIHKQQRQFQNYAKLMTIFNDTISSAVGIETHSERYSNADSKVSQIYVFISALYNHPDNMIIPVLLEGKTFTDNTSPILYIVVSLHQIDRSRILGHTPDYKRTEPYPLPASFKVSLADLLTNVNHADTNLLKYIPDGFLNDTQKVAKQDAIKKTAAYIERKNKQRYITSDDLKSGSDFVSEGIINYVEDDNCIIFIFRKRTCV